MHAFLKLYRGGGRRACPTPFLVLAGGLSFCAVVVIAELALADGLPIDTDRQHCLGVYTVILLTTEQDLEVQRQRLFTPTSEQLELLRQINPDCPAKLRVVTPWFNDCGCGMHGYVLWFRPGEIEVPHGVIGRWPLSEIAGIRCDAAAGDTTAISFLAGSGPEARDADARIARHALNSLVMDLGGHLYYNGVEVDTAEILAIVDREVAAAAADSARAGAASDCRELDSVFPNYLWLHMPPLGQDLRPRLFDGLFELARKLARRGYELAFVG